MFTGLIEEIGTVSNVVLSEAGSRLSIQARNILKDAKLGDSIAVDGVCTTIVDVNHQQFSIDASPETLSKTTFQYLHPGRRVNLERPLTPVSRVGGHFVTGHVDGTASIIAKFQEGNSWIYRLMLDQPELAMYLIPKGSVAVNGISLTVNTVDRHVFSVAIIPHTLRHTNLDDYQPGGDGAGDTVNIECDMLGKYVHRLLCGARGGEVPVLGMLESLDAYSGVYPGAELAEAAQAKLADTETHHATPAKGKIHSGVWFCHDEAIHGPASGQPDALQGVPQVLPSLTPHWPERSPEA